jgi:hypothetical protein
MTRRLPNSGSWNDYLRKLAVSEVRWIETTRERYANDMRIINTPKSRRPEILKDREFTTALYTGVPMSTKEDVTYLIKLMRIA